MKSGKKTNDGELVLYKTRDGKTSLELKLKKETIWLSQAQIAALFSTQRPAVTKHLGNIFKTKELDKNSVCSVLEHTASDGKTYKTKFYNLDAVIAVGYRVNSKKATQFRIWATDVLKDHLLKGYTFNQKRIRKLRDGQLKEFQQAVGLISKTIETKQLTGSESSGLLRVITDYASSWLLLQKYDEGQLEAGKSTKAKYFLNYEDAADAVTELKRELTRKKEAGALFGLEKDKSFQGILGNLNQTYGGEELYRGIEEKAAHLLYFIIKDHPFGDGNKRIGSFLFILFLARNRFLFKKNGKRKINDNALVALALLIAESDPKQKDVMIKLIINFLKD